MKSLILSFLFLFYALNITSCAQGELVYLAAVAAKASSFDQTPDWAPKPDPMAPVDGDLQTRWSPMLGFDNEWIYFDFGRLKTMTKIIVRWEKAYAVDYEILISNGLKEWRRVVFMKDQDGGVDEMTFAPVKGRYVKIIGFKRSNPVWGFSMWEFEPYGPAELNPDDKPIEEVYLSRVVVPADEELEEVVLVEEEPLASPGPIGMDEFHKGVVYTSWDPTGLATRESDRTIRHLASRNVGHVALMTTWYQDEVDSIKVAPIGGPGGKTPADETLGHAINLIHSLGMKVMLKPHVDARTGEWRGNIIPSDEWFASYEKFILHYAELAKKFNVELFCVGTELANTTIPGWEKKWRKVFEEVRKVYNGPLVYAANWNEYMDVPFWDALEFIGIDAYFPLTSKNDPTKDELIQAWESHADVIENWLKSKGLTQPVLFTEIGYDTIDGSNRRPWREMLISPDLVEDQQEQADCLDAVLSVLTKRNWFRGIYWWNYFPKEGVGVLGFTLRGKLGEESLVGWYGKDLDLKLKEDVKGGIVDE